MKPVRAIDLFCGAGGTSSGLLDACRQLGRPVDLLAINHWPTAIETHEANHPGVRHLCAAVETVSPSEAVPGRYLDLLVASPECVFFSTARGGRPINDQKRADPWQVVRWAGEIRIDNLLIENVPEFRAWGPLDGRGRPLKSQRGRTYRTYLDALRGLGYTVEDRVLCAADYGDPTTRRRLFILARRGTPVRWPEPTHAPARSLLPGQQPWRAAREIIDWSLDGESIFGRRRALSRNTMERIVAGLQKFGGPELGPFLVILRGTDPEQLRMSARPIDLPLPTISAGGGHAGLVEPFLVGAGGPRGRQKARSLDEPLGTVLADEHQAVVQPFLVHVNHADGDAGRVRSVEEPLPTVTATQRGLGLVEPFILPPLGVHPRNGKANTPRSTGDPLQTVTAARGGGHLVQPFLVPYRGERDGQRPRTHSVDEPMPAVTAETGHALVEALLTKYYGTGVAKPVSEPLDTVTTRDRFGLVTFEKDHAGLALDIRFRMLQPHELAGAQGFDNSYRFAGTKGDQVRQIGNAVPRGLAKALCLVLLT